MSCAKSDSDQLDKDAQDHVLSIGLIPANAEFRHAALDLSTPSIRLIQILPELSAEGHLQCTLLHATIGSAINYKCLSYRWGYPDRGQCIAVNGQRFLARQNLWNFLHYAHLGRLDDWFWIDAISIDQRSTEERNHQVQNMGQIYSSAVEVITWLGTDTRIATYLQRIRDYDDSSTAVLARGLDALLEQTYWDRAWIAQEILLARKVTLAACSVYLPMHRLPWSYYGLRDDPNFSSAGTFQKLLRFRPSRMVYEKRQDLIHLLWVFRGSQCFIARDRMFSLLSLCTAGSDLTVDYNMPVETLAINALKTCREKFCFCTTHYVGDALRIEEFTEFDTGLDIAFARLVLPVAARPGSAYTPGRKYIPVGSRTLQSVHTSPSDQRGIGSLELIFWLSDVCAAYDPGYEVKIKSSRLGTSGWSSWFCNEQFIGSFDNHEPGPSLQLSEDCDYWIITFNLKILLEIVRGAAQYDPVNRSYGSRFPCWNSTRWIEGDSQALHLL